MKAIDLQQAVADAINSGTYTHAVQAAAGLMPDWKAEDLHALTVTVAAMTRDAAAGDRVGNEYITSVFIAIGKAVNRYTYEEIKPLIALVDAIDDHLAEVGTIEMPGGVLATWDESRIDPYYDPDVMREWLIFAAGIEVQFQSL